MRNIFGAEHQAPPDGSFNRGMTGPQASGNGSGSGGGRVFNFNLPGGGQGRFVVGGMSLQGGQIGPAQGGLDSYVLAEVPKLD